ncbi:MAG: efflux RND transporter periplasmic adaptor subunit [Nitrospirae bacterium]|nr:efflux RND transporter periplasmic adaptor subunit [Nitrospirota bacterium]
MKSTRVPAGRRLAGGLIGALLLMLVMSCTATFTGCAKKDEKKKDKKPAPVLAAKAETRDVPVTLAAIGNVEAYSTVNVRSLVGGEVTGVHFREGQDVRKGELLFTIDARPLEAELMKAEAELAEDMVEAENAETDAARYKALLDRGAVSRQQYDQARTLAASLKEVVGADRAEIGRIKVQLGYTRIFAPVSGRTGAIGVHMGNVVRANDAPDLVTINQLRPIYVTFSVPGGALSEVRRLDARSRLSVTARPTGDPGPPAAGRLSFIDNAVDPATATIRLKAVFDNSDGRLWPGQFVDVSVLMSTRAGATVVPEAAVLSGQKGQYVYVVKPDNTAEERLVGTDGTVDGYTVVLSGVRTGETVVTDGQLRLVPGTAVEVKAGL